MISCIKLENFKLESDRNNFLLKKKKALRKNKNKIKFLAINQNNYANGRIGVVGGGRKAEGYKTKNCEGLKTSVVLSPTLA